MDVVTKILSVTVGATKNGKQYFAVKSADGQERRCWDAALATKVNSFADPMGQGPDVTLRYDVTQNGQYTNYSVKGVFGPGEMVTPDTGGSSGGGGFSGGGGGGGRKGGYPPEVETRITKLASFEYATTLVAGLFAGAGPDAFEEAWALTEETAKRIYKAARAHEKVGTTTNGTGALAPGAPAPGDGTIQPVATTPQGVAAAMPPGTVQVGAPVAAQAQDAAAEAPDVVDWD